MDSGLSSPETIFSPRNEEPEAAEHARPRRDADSEAARDPATDRKWKPGQTQRKQHRPRLHRATLIRVHPWLKNRGARPNFVTTGAAFEDKTGKAGQESDPHHSCFFVCIRGSTTRSDSEPAEEPLNT